MQEGWGILVQNTQKEQVTISGLTVTRAVSEQNGAGIAVDNVDLVIENCQITQNTNKANQGIGGGLYLIRSSAIIRNSVFSENDTSGEFSMGGAVYLENCQVILEDSEILNNTNSGIRAGLPGVIANLSDLVVKRCCFEGNNFNSPGGGFTASQSHVTVTDSYFTNNEFLTCLHLTELPKRIDYPSISHRSVAK
jgi:hypothetical protein